MSKDSFEGNYVSLRNAEKFQKSHHVGSEFICYYDFKKPTNVVFNFGNNTIAITMEVIGGIIFAIGLTILIGKVIFINLFKIIYLFFNFYIKVVTLPQKTQIQTVELKEKNSKKK